MDCPERCKLGVTSGYVFASWVATVKGGKIVEFNEYLKLTDEQKQLVSACVAAADPRDLE